MQNSRPLPFGATYRCGCRPARVRRATASGSATPRPARRGLRPRGCGPSVRGPQRSVRAARAAPGPGGARPPGAGGGTFAALGWSRGCGPAVHRVPAVARAAPGPRGLSKINFQNVPAWPWAAGRVRPGVPARRGHPDCRTGSDVRTRSRTTRDTSVVAVRVWFVMLKRVFNRLLIGLQCANSYTEPQFTQPCVAFSVVEAAGA